MEGSATTYHQPVMRCKRVPYFCSRFAVHQPRWSRVHEAQREINLDGLSQRGSFWVGVRFSVRLALGRAGSEAASSGAGLQAVETRCSVADSVIVLTPQLWLDLVS